MLRETVKSLSLDIFESWLDTALSNLLWARDWTRWSPELPSNLNQLCESVILLVSLTTDTCDLLKAGKEKHYLQSFQYDSKMFFPVINVIHQFRQGCQNFKK